MVNLTHPARTPATGAEPLFARVVCGIDGSRASLEAARQAAVLAGGGELRLGSVTWTTGTGPTEMSALSERRARAALEAAGAAAREIGATVATDLIRDPDAAQALLKLASDADLTVVGIHGGSRRTGIFLGSVASRVVHRASGPVLVARRPASGSQLSQLVVASDGSPGSSEATQLAGRVAARFGASVTLLHACGSSTSAQRHAIAVQVAELLDVTGTKPIVVEREGNAPDLIADTARSEQASLVIVGSRGLGGLKALGSVSERVAHAAPCSVLVARPSAAAG